METADNNPTPPPRKGLPCLVFGLIGLVVLIAAGFVLFPVAIYFYAYVLNHTTG